MMSRQKHCQKTNSVRRSEEHLHPQRQPNLPRLQTVRERSFGVRVSALDLLLEPRSSSRSQSLELRERLHTRTSRSILTPCCSLRISRRTMTENGSRVSVYPYIIHCPSRSDTKALCVKDPLSTSLHRSVEWPEYRKSVSSITTTAPNIIHATQHETVPVGRESFASADCK